MDDELIRDEKVMTIVTAALKLDAGEREAFLRSACGSDAQLHQEVCEAVEWEQRMGSFLKEPMSGLTKLILPFAVGQTVAERFEIVREIGEGGMSVVYEAIDKIRNLRIAIKSPKPGFDDLLFGELEGSLRVRHQNVCLVNDIHSTPTAAGNVKFLTMELLEGETLSALLRREGRLGAEKAKEIALQLCAGLRAVHESGVIHRDLKSSNVILCRRGDGGLRAVITDFGLSGEAKRTGFFGTHRYMAPELLLEKRGSRASDIYALGVILYEMVAGVQPDSDSAQKDSVPSSRPYQRLVADFLSLEPERRMRAFDEADERLSRHAGYSRRELFGVGAVATLCAAASGGFLGREQFENWLHPLPKKRLVALLTWPPDLDVELKRLVSGAVDAIGNELAREESQDRDLLVVEAREGSVRDQETGWMQKLGTSLGVNLLMQASGLQRNRDFELTLKLMDVSSGKVLRESQVGVAREAIGELASNAVAAAARLLNVRWDDRGSERLRPGSESPAARQAFQAAEELRKRPNDAGLQEAVGQYNQAIEADSKFSEAYGGLAATYARLYRVNLDPGALALGRANAEKAIRLNPKSTSGHLSLARIFDAGGDYQAAHAEVKTAAQLDPANPKILILTAQIYRDSRQWHEAEQAYLRLLSDRPNYWVAHSEYGTVLDATGRFEEAIGEFQVAAAAAPGSAYAFNNLGALHFKLGRLREAEENYRRSLAIKPEAGTCMNLGEILRVEHKFGEAIRFCEKALDLAPLNDESWLELADCYEAMGQHQREAAAAFRRAATAAEQRLHANPNDGAAWTRLALYHIKNHSESEAWACLKKAGPAGSLDMDSELLRVRVFELGGKRKEAIDLAEGCLKKGPVGFQMQGIEDLRGLIRDPGYLRIKKTIVPGKSVSKSPA